MATYFRVMPTRNLAYCHYDGVVTMAKADKLFREYMQHPDHAPGQLQLVDFSHATGWDAGFISLMQTQAIMADTFLKAGSEVLIVFLAPTPLSREMAVTTLRSWQGVAGLIPLLAETEEEALSLLGQPEVSIAALVQAADHEAAHRRG